MAYKFQRGAAILSGSIKAEDGLVSTDVDDATAANDDKNIDSVMEASRKAEILEFIDQATQHENTGVGQDSDWYWTSSA